MFTSAAAKYNNKVEIMRKQNMPQTRDKKIQYGLCHFA